MMERKSANRRNACPLCGGKIIVSVLYQLSYDYTVTKSGKLSKRYSVSAPGPLDAEIAACENAPDKCKATWDTDEFYIDEKNRFVDLKYGGDE